MIKNIKVGSQMSELLNKISNEALSVVRCIPARLSVNSKMKEVALSYKERRGMVSKDGEDLIYISIIDDESGMYLEYFVSDKKVQVFFDEEGLIVSTVVEDDSLKECIPDLTSIDGLLDLICDLSVGIHRIDIEVPNLIKDGEYEYYVSNLENHKNTDEYSIRLNVDN